MDTIGSYFVFNIDLWHIMTFIMFGENTSYNLLLYKVIIVDLHKQ